MERSRHRQHWGPGEQSMEGIDADELLCVMDPGKKPRKRLVIISLGHLDGNSFSDAGRTEQKPWGHRDVASNTGSNPSEVCDLGHKTAALILSFLICEMGIQAAPTSCGCWDRSVKKCFYVSGVVTSNH